MYHRKKLIEVALPLEKINAASAREKSIRHGHPSTLHLWWARRPLAAARAVIFAQMVDDPSAWPDLFPTEEAQDAERQRLFRLIEELVLWENTTNEDLLQQARDEIWRSWRRTCAENQDHPQAAELFNPDKLPAFHDPFAGGGALPLEAQRLGLEAYGSDLNPVAVLINKAMIEIPPKFAGMPPVNPEARKGMFTAEDASWERGRPALVGTGEGGTPSLPEYAPRHNNPLPSAVDTTWRGAAGLAADVRYYGQWMRDEAEKRIGHLYPKIRISAEDAKERRDLLPYVGKELTVIAWLWARTVKSPNPAFAHVDVPLASTFMLSTKAGKEAYVEPVIEPGSEGVPPSYRFTVKVGKPKDAEAAKNGTKLARGANFRCLMSEMPIAGDYIKAEGVAGRMGARLMAIVAEGHRGRVYLAPTPEHEAIARQAQPEWAPEVEIAPDRRSMFTPLYGMTHFKHLFTPRQLVALNTFADLVGEVRERVRTDYLGARASRPRAMWHRTHLPHFEAGETPQHITFRLADSLPSTLLASWRAELAQLPATERAVEHRKRIETYLDQGHGSCTLRDPQIAEIVANALHYFDGIRYQLHEWVIMPNHVHVLITPLHDNSLSSILHSWKSFTAKQVNNLLGLKEAFWQEDYFDRVIRDERHWNATVTYIRENPVKAGLCATPEEWRFGSAGDDARAGDDAWDRGRDALDENGTRAGRPRSQDGVALAAGGSGAQAYADAVAVYLGFAISKITNIGSSIASWMSDRGAFRETFARQAIPMVWDFAEANAFTDTGGSFGIAINKIAMAIDYFPTATDNLVQQADACSQKITFGKLVSTDPPYYDNIGYADLSDFFVSVQAPPAGSNCGAG